eukprot:7112955-Heterocapsa_arctica.AAC.1
MPACPFPVLCCLAVGSQHLSDVVIPVLRGLRVPQHEHDGSVHLVDDLEGSPVGPGRKLEPDGLLPEVPCLRDAGE